MGGTVSWIVFLQIGCGVIPVSQFQFCSETLGHGMVAESLALHPWHLRFTPSDQGFQGEVEF